MSRLQELRRLVYEANMELHRRGLVVETFGNVSGIDRDRGVVAIKPSGISYDALEPSSIVLVDLEGRPVEPGLHPSSDTPTHLRLYRGFPQIGGIAHTHSLYATVWAQAAMDLPCLGTTHADYFHGAVPVTAALGKERIDADYEAATGDLIVETFTARRLSYRNVPAVLVARHGPFTWGADAQQAVFHSGILEYVARIGLLTRTLAPGAPPVSSALLDRHYLRKHGAGAYYGQR